MLAGYTLPASVLCIHRANIVSPRFHVVAYLPVRAASDYVKSISALPEFIQIRVNLIIASHQLRRCNIKRNQIKSYIKRKIRVYH